MDDCSKTAAFIDIGTNSIHMLVVRFFEGCMGTPVFQDKETVRLGQSLYKTGAIDQETIDKARLVMSRFVRMSRDMGAEEIVACATCAAREAENSRSLIDALESEGVDVRVISGLEEARLIKLGVFGPEGPQKRSLNIDIGGGSTEIALCAGKEDIHLDSLSIGSVRFAYGAGVDLDHAMTFQEYDFLRRKVDLLSYRTCRKVKEAGFERAYGSSGTMIALAEMCAVRRGDGDASYMMYYEVVQLMKGLYSKSVEERLSVPGMNPSRADIIVSGGAIAEELMYLLGIDRIEISPNGMKQGMEIDYLMNRGHTEFDVKDSSVTSLANRCHYDRAHAENVRRNALFLFDSMKGEGLHAMGGGMRALLSYAATLHDIGEFISYTRHNIHSYTIILNSYLPGFDNRELRIMALMARFHHKKFPRRDSKYLEDMNPKERDEVLMCAMILKIADILDRHHNSSVTERVIETIDGDAVLTIGSSEDISMEVWKLNTTKEEFFDVFRRPLKVVKVAL
ncbi:MAG: Ppx/GppA family phosphatase [Candidatus Methanoplasma sp.]|jgi:exopolyphosphatase/guanosine-5'-triphosphate,3'-diphosphate pyrophosphatase|nr:Ppx/GppA family phosphatase [Candidatus Methanoplasma sp.]